jgi:hypothetical protein
MAELESKLASMQASRNANSKDELIEQYEKEMRRSSEEL